MLRAATLPLATLLVLLAPAQAERSLLQADGLGILGTSILSAVPADTINDPGGRAHLLARLGNPHQYFAKYPYPRPEGEYAIDPRIDPARDFPIPGNRSPANGTYKVVGVSGAISVHAIPFPNGEILFYGRGSEGFGGGDPAGPGANFLRVDNGQWTEIASIYNTITNTYQPFHITESPFCGAQTLLPDGRAILVGGSHTNLWYPYLQFGGVAVRIYDPNTHVIETVNTLDRFRCSVNGSYENSTISTACVPNAGGSPGDAYYDNPTYTIYNYTANSFSTSLTLTILLDAFPINLYPYAWVLPTGSTLIMTGVSLGAMFLTANGATQDNAVGPLPKLPKPVGPNQYTGATLLPLEPPTMQRGCV
ncbi:hypothetical protein WJX84_008187 [Apatococcus fuscideae]|uniref:Uncharacterized protein n=1 Tax=Apatococcus fuscideae TaxID=2026836 RepID=A0AAW1TD32_9CHLO